MEAKREKALNLSQAGLGPKAISDTLNMPISTVYRVIKAGTIKRKTSTRPGNIKATPEFLLRLKRTVEAKPTESIRSVAKKFDVHERTIRRSLKLLGKKSVVRPPRHLLTERQKEVRLERGKRLLNHLKSLPPSTVRIFSDKKIFTVDQTYNRRNDRQIVDLGCSGDPVSRTKHPASIMLLGIVASNGKKAPPIFVPEGEKVNTEAHITMLKSRVLPWLKKTFPQGNFNKTLLRPMPPKKPKNGSG
jgi:transposase